MATLPFSVLRETPAHLLVSGSWVCFAPKGNERKEDITIFDTNPNIQSTRTLPVTARRSTPASRTPRLSVMPRLTTTSSTSADAPRLLATSTLARTPRTPWQRTRLRRLKRAARSQSLFTRSTPMVLVHSHAIWIRRATPSPAPARFLSRSPTTSPAPTVSPRQRLSSSTSLSRCLLT